MTGPLPIDFAEIKRPGLHDSQSKLDFAPASSIKAPGLRVKNPREYKREEYEREA